MAYSLYDKIGYVRASAENVKHKLLDGTEHVQTMAVKSVVECHGVFVNENEIQLWLSQYVDMNTGQFTGIYTAYYLEGEPVIERSYKSDNFVNVRIAGTARATAD